MDVSALVLEVPELLGRVGVVVVSDVVVVVKDAVERGPGEEERERERDEEDGEACEILEGGGAMEADEREKGEEEFVASAERGFDALAPVWNSNVSS